MSPFQQKVIDLIRLIPQGKVASYGQIALYAGLPRAAREVGGILKQTKEDLPWWRVVNNEGRISIEGNWEADKGLQKKLLIAENVEVREDFAFDIEKYRWIMPESEVRKLQLPSEYIDRIIEKHIGMSSKIKVQKAKPSSKLKVNNLKLFD
ncbi:MAG: MGMT family protein [bacterium]|nr:MGMT family protein [bacterium]